MLFSIHPELVLFQGTSGRLCREMGLPQLIVLFKILAGIISGPVALFSFSFCNSFKTPSVVTWMSGIVGDGSPSGNGNFRPVFIREL